MNEKLIMELRRRLKDRNAGGYWGCNARAWIKRLLKELRETRQKK